MNWLLTDDEFARAASGVRSGEVTPALYEFVARLVASHLRTGLVAPSLSSSGAWTEEAIADVTHDWFVEKLLPGGLLRAFDRTATPHALARYLERALRNWLRDKARSRAWPRIIVRARAILEEGGRFVALDDPPNWMTRQWALRGWPAPVPPADEGAVIAAVYSVPELEILRESSESGRAATLLSTPELERLLVHVFESVRAAISLSQLDRAFRHRFAWAFEAPTVALDETPAYETRSEELASATATKETALAILADLTRRQLEMLRARADGATLEQLAEAHECSRGTADNELRRAGEVVRRHVADDDAQARILEILLSLSFPERG